MEFSLYFYFGRPKKPNAMSSQRIAESQPCLVPAPLTGEKLGSERFKRKVREKRERLEGLLMSF